MGVETGKQISIGYTLSVEPEGVVDRPFGREDTLIHRQGIGRTGTLHLRGGSTEAA